MKKRATTLTFKRLTTKTTLVVAAAIMAISAPIAIMPNALARDYNAEINAIQDQINQYNGEAARLNKEASSLEREVARLNAEKRAIQAQVDLSQAKYEKLQQEIKDNEKKILDNKDALGVTLADMSVDTSISPLEMLASSNNIGDYVDKQAYRMSVNDQLKSTIDLITALKKELEKQKIDVERVLKDQTAQRQTLAAKEAEQQQLMEATKSNANAYLQSSAKMNAQINYLREQQRLAFAAISPGSSSSPTGYAINYKNWSGNSSCGGGYSYCGYGLDEYVVDPWSLGLTAECVHYTADWLARHGYYIPAGAFAPARGGGNANQWIPNATANGFGTVVGTPQYGDVAYMAVPGVGHVGIVEHNYGNGWVRISQYNFATYGTAGYSTMDLQITSATQFLRFSK